MQGDGELLAARSQEREEIWLRLALAENRRAHAMCASSCPAPSPQRGSPCPAALWDR